MLLVVPPLMVLPNRSIKPESPVCLTSWMGYTWTAAVGPVDALGGPAVDGLAEQVNQTEVVGLFDVLDGLHMDCCCWSR